MTEHKNVEMTEEGKSLQSMTAERDYYSAERDRLCETNAELLEALKAVVPDTHGNYGGPLVQAVAMYEDGSESTISPEKYKAARAAIAKAKS